MHHISLKGMQDQGGVVSSSWVIMEGTTCSTAPSCVAAASLMPQSLSRAAAESEYAAAYLNAKDAAQIRETLEALGYSQGATHIISDNSFVCNLVSGECNAKRSRSMDMRFFWLRDRVEQGQFKVMWHGSEQNIADYFTKDLPTKESTELLRSTCAKINRRNIQALSTSGSASGTPNKKSRSDSLTSPEKVHIIKHVHTNGDEETHRQQQDLFVQQLGLQVKRQRADDRLTHIADLEKEIDRLTKVLEPTEKDRERLTRYQSMRDDAYDDHLMKSASERC
jgi:hypothetical protein